MQSVSTLSTTATGDDRFVIHTVQDPTVTLDLDLGIPIKEELRLPTGTKIAITRVKADFKGAQTLCSQLTLAGSEPGTWYAARSAKDTTGLEASPTHKITIEQLAEYLGSSKWREVGFNPFFWSSSQGCLDHYAGYGVNLDGAVPMCANIKYQYAVICVQ